MLQKISREKLLKDYQAKRKEKKHQEYDLHSYTAKKRTKHYSMSTWMAKNE